MTPFANEVIESLNDQLTSVNIAVVIPAYKVSREIGFVLQSIPRFVKHIIVVNDASPDNTADVITSCSSSDPRITVINHLKNQGVGAAMISGFKKCLETNAQIIVKIDGDGQMHADDLPLLLFPLLDGRADFTKGNRFLDSNSLKRMPMIRRLGNIALSFLVKLATGNWHIFDPTNGFLALRREALEAISFQKLDNTYYFEISLLAQLYLAKAMIIDVPIPARYGNEISNLSIKRTLFEFPKKLIKTLGNRILWNYFLIDFSVTSLYLIIGIPLLTFGVLFGGINWFMYASNNLPAPTGTIMIATLSVMLSFQLLLAAISNDVNSIPNKPITRPLVRRKSDLNE